MSEGVVLEARDLGVHYGLQSALSDVSLRVERGKVLTVLGPTGAGKTTLFRALVGERVPERGSIWLKGQDVTGDPLWRRARKGIGYVPQGVSVLPDLSVDANLSTYEALVGRALGARYWARLVGLDHRLSVGAASLSGGERRLLELARALIGGPSVIVCDEPFSGIDPIGARKVVQLLRAKAEEGLAIVLADHHAGLALEVCDEALLLLDGQVRCQGSPSVLRQDLLVRERYLGWDG